MSSPRILSHISGIQCVRHSRPFLEVLRPLISQLETGFTGFSSLLAAVTPTPPAIDARDDIDMQPDKDRAISTEAMAGASERSLERLPEEEGEAKKQKFVSTSSKRGEFTHLKRHLNATFCA